MSKPREGDLELAGVRLRAVSVGGLETCIEVPDWKLCFDIGRCPPTAARLPRVLITHPHVDHLGGIAHHVALRDLWGMSPPEYVIPAEYAADFEALLHAWRRLDRAELPCTVRAIAPGERFALGRGRFVEAFRAVHRIPTLGYALIEQRRRLRADLHGLSSEEIRARRQSGEEVSEVADEPVVAFCGDTTIDVLRHDLVRKAKVLVLEATFLDEVSTVERARRFGHVHLDEVIARAEEFENQAILLTHFSARYTAERVQRILAARLPESLRARVTALLPGLPWVEPAPPGGDR